MAAKRALIDRAVGVAVKRHAHVLKVIDNLGCFTAHVLDGVLVAKPVGTFDSVVKVVVPVVFTHVSERCANAALRSNGVRARRKHFGQHRYIQPSTCKLQRRTHTRAACTDDYHIKFTFWNFGNFGHGSLFF